MADDVFGNNLGYLTKIIVKTKLTLKCTVDLVFIVNGALQDIYVCMYKKRLSGH